MNAIQRKLHSNEGASFVLALLFFLMCAGVSAVILTAATASGGRLSEFSRNDQRREALTSAAVTLGDSFANGSGIRIMKVTVDRDGVPEGEPSYHYYTVSKEVRENGIQTSDNLNFTNVGDSISDTVSDHANALLQAGIFRFFSDAYTGSEKEEEYRVNTFLDPNEPALLRNGAGVPLTAGMQFRMEPDGDLQLILFGPCSEDQAKEEFDKSGALHRGKLNAKFQYLKLQSNAKKKEDTYSYSEEERETAVVDGVETEIAHTITTTTEFKTIYWDRYDIVKFFGDET